MVVFNRTTYPSRRGKSRLLAKVQHLKEITSQEIIFDADVEKEEGGLGLCFAGGKGSDLVFKGRPFMFLSINKELSNSCIKSVGLSDFYLFV